MGAPKLMELVSFKHYAYIDDGNYEYMCGKMMVYDLH